MKSRNLLQFPGLQPVAEERGGSAPEKIVLFGECDQTLMLPIHAIMPLQEHRPKGADCAASLAACAKTCADD